MCSHQRACRQLYDALRVVLLPVCGCNAALQVCYSWWCLSCLAILDRLHWIDQKALTRFILYCQVGTANAAPCMVGHMRLAVLVSVRV